MTVRELIEKLQEFPPDMEVEAAVEVEPDGDDYYIEFGAVSDAEMCNHWGNTVRIS